MREPYRDRDPHRQEQKIKDQQQKEHLTFRSFCTGQGRDAAAFLAPPPRRPGLVVGTRAVEETAGMVAQLGQQVRLQNMKRRHELNGLAGTVVSDKTDQFGRIYVNISQKDAEPHVIKVLPERLQHQGGEDPYEQIPSWMPHGREVTDPLGASFWSSSGIRTGFPGFGIMQEKQWSQPELREKYQEISKVSHRAFVRTVCGGFLPEQSSESVRPFSGQPAQLEHALLAVVRANSMNEVLYAPMCGLVLVTKVEEQALQLLCPAPPPLPTSYLLVGDFKSMKFIDI
eukprot:symbB.v1.2.022935.t1/scaffold2056.1/size90925/9